MTAPAAIDRLRRIAARLVELGDADSDWFAAALTQYESSARFGLSIDEALGLRPGRGQTAWWEMEANNRRDELIRQIAKRFFGDLVQRDAAAAIIGKARLYESATWKTHRQFTSPPESIQGSLRGDLFLLLKTGAPLSVRTAQRALCHQTADFVAQRQCSTTDNDGGSPIERNVDEAETDEGPGRNPAAADCG